MSTAVTPARILRVNWRLTIRTERDSEVVYDRHTPHRLSADEPFTIDDVLGRVESYVEDDFAGMRLSELVFQDEDGNDL